MIQESLTTIITGRSSITHANWWHKHCTENPVYLFPEMESRGLSDSVPTSTFICLLAIYIFQGSVHIFSWSRIGRPIVEIYKSLTDTWMWKSVLRPRNSFSGTICLEFSVLCLCSADCHPPIRRERLNPLGFEHRWKPRLMIQKSFAAIGPLQSIYPTTENSASFSTLGMTHAFLC